MAQRGLIMIDKRMLPDSVTIKKPIGEDDWGKRLTLTLFIYPLASSIDPFLILEQAIIVASPILRL